MTFTVEHWSVLLVGLTLTVALLRHKPAALAVALALWLAALTVHWPRFTLFEIVVGSTGAMSIMSMAAALTALAAAFGAPAPGTREINSVARALALTGTVLYVSAFGFTMFDPYRFGFTPSNLLFIALPALAVSVWKGWLWLPAVLALVFTGYRLGVLPSANWWDYLVDPLVWISSVIYLIAARPRPQRSDAAPETAA